METAIKWFNNRKGKVTYSMVNRYGPNSYDCSSAIYYALISADIFPANIRIGNTDSLFKDLENAGFTQLPRDSNGDVAVQRGDVFIWGKRGASSGASGHTGVFVDTTNIIHCNYGYNGISVNDHDYIWQINGQPEYTFYRYVGKPAPQVGINRGDTVKLAGRYTVDRRAVANGITQVSSLALYLKNFTWDDNGIPVAAINKVDKDGYHLAGTTEVGEQFVIPGKFTVSDVMDDQGVTYALLNNVGGYEVWVVTSALTEVGASDNGTPKPSLRPPQTPAPTLPPQTKPPETIPPTTAPPKTIPPQTQPPTTNPPKEDKQMAFTKADQKELTIATERVSDIANEIADSDQVIEITNNISKKTKLAVYIVGDSLIGLGLIVPNLAIVFNFGTVNQIVALSSGLASLGGFMLTMFGIYKSK